MSKIHNKSEPTNGGAVAIEFGMPYRVSATITGTADLMMHRYNPEAVAAKSAAAKNSKAKKSDDVESYVYRNPDGELCVPGVAFHSAIYTAAKSRQDPRSPRKSAMDLYKAGVVVETQLASMGVSTWDYLDTRRVVVQRNAVSRVRPAMLAGWQATFFVTVITPEYIDPGQLHEVMAMAGRLIGVGDFRPTFGRFNVSNFEVLED